MPLGVEVGLSRSDFVLDCMVGCFDCVDQSVERRSLAGVILLSCARPAADG